MQSLEREVPMPSGGKANSQMASVSPFQQARQLAWEAAVIVQHPPHPVDTWQAAKVKWRQAVQLLETIPATDPQASAVQRKLADYRAKYTAIAHRLEAEQAADSYFEQGQTLAWQAAVTVREVAPSLKDWQRANTKWSQAIQAMAAVPPRTTLAHQAHAKLGRYRLNQEEIRQRLAADQKVLATLTRFASVADQLKAQQTKAVLSQTGDTTGLVYEEYQQLVRSLKTAMQTLDDFPLAKRHPAYDGLKTALADYEFALSIWQSYLQHQQANSDWLNGDEFYNQLMPLSLIDRDRLFKHYSNIKIYSSSRGDKIPLKFTLWEIWDQAKLEVVNLQQKVVALQ